MARARYRAARCQALGAQPDIHRRAGAIKRLASGISVRLIEADHDRKRCVLDVVAVGTHAA